MDLFPKLLPGKPILEKYLSFLCRNNNSTTRTRLLSNGIHVMQ